VNALPLRTRCREIRESDLEGIADLLTRGFFGRPRDYWMAGLRRQAIRDVPDGYPRFGYMLESEGMPVGVLLLLYTAQAHSGETAIRCNLSSWYVEPAFRNYAPMLTKIAQRHKHVTYFNISPATWTWPIIETQGFSAYCRGLFFSVPLFARGHRMTVEIVSADTRSIEGLADDEAAFLARHARYGCLSLVCRTGDGRAFPFVLLAMRIRRGWIAPPAMQLVYCRDMSEFVACAGAIGRLLLRRGKVSVLVDSNGRVPGLVGLYTEKRGRKYFRGPHRPRLGDLADTELVLYGP
jgi:hypothetical protein